MTIASHYYPCEREGICSSFRCEVHIIRWWMLGELLTWLITRILYSISKSGYSLTWYKWLNLALADQNSWIEVTSSWSSTKAKSYPRNSWCCNHTSRYVVEIQLLSANIKWYQFYLCWPNRYFLHLELMWWFVLWWKT